MKALGSLAALLALALGGVSIVASASCTDAEVHVFGGYSYDPDLDCLDTSGAVDVISGPDPGTCSKLRCWLSPDGVAYVTDKACDAPPDYKDETASTTGLCVKALATYAKKGHDLCPVPADAGTDDDGE